MRKAPMITLLLTGLALIAEGSTCPPPSPSALSSRNDSAIVASVQATPVCRYEEGLSDLAFSRWLQGMAGRSARFRWKLVRGCWLAPAPELPEDLPVCVEVRWEIPGADRGGLVRVSVGTERRRGHQVHLGAGDVELIMARLSDAPSANVELNIRTLRELEQRFREAARSPD